MQMSIVKMYDIDQTDAYFSGNSHTDYQKINIWTGILLTILYFKRGI